jgi:hypothetical protein
MSDESIFHYLKVPFLTSSVSACISLVIYPLDLMNTVVKAAPKLQSISATARQLYQREGLKGFYKGTSLLLLENFGSNMIYFFLYDYLNKTLSKKYDENGLKQRWTIPVITSFVSEVGCLMVYVPCDTILTRMQSHSEVYKYKSIYHAFRSVIREEGLLRLFHSSYLLIVNSLIYTTVQFSCYEWLKSFYVHKYKNQHFGIKESILTTICSTSLAIFLSNPFDTLIIKHQMTNFVLEKDQHIMKIISEELRLMGLRTFTKGIPLRLLSLNASGLAILPFYEMFRQKFGFEVNF